MREGARADQWSLNKTTSHTLGSDCDRRQSISNCSFHLDCIFSVYLHFSLGAIKPCRKVRVQVNPQGMFFIPVKGWKFIGSWTFLVADVYKET